MDTFSELIARWRRQAEEYGRDGALVRGDALLRRCAEELEDAGARTVDTAEAEGLSGYSAGHLRELAADGVIPAERNGERGRYSFKVQDLPVKPGHRGRGMGPVDEVARLRSKSDT